MSELTLERLRELLDYNPDTGFFRNRVTRGGQFRGKIAGSADEFGYWYIAVDGTKYAAHRLAWFYVTGTWPAHGIDHKNRCPGDNRFENLREADQSHNNMNCKVRKTSRAKMKGVKIAGRKFQARIRQSYLGTFDTAEEAHAAYVKAAKDQFGDFARGA